MRQILRRPVVRALVAAALLLFVLVGGYGTYLANQAGRLPWQEDPTRIPVVPFEGLDVPGFAPQTPVAATPVP
ncbi:MAG: hypothetical protein AVDCRST_MAG19-591 [uncultured Thermomicrobiales bacterium]|uniref:Uncharacterized protein n=1 Tax=uncultured Thermomicrobiales bacterium TaxID=1645740 RepID=A0A6J4UF48_9BACT|nr:MAG: hypothetical protein AVDCRST_MAG19-591 [uncultured Thermomicrobiales bacterium]